MSGRVTLEVDSATSYVVYDGKSPSQLLDLLGIKAFSDLPSRAVCVRWDWVASCKRNASPRLSAPGSLPISPRFWNRHLGSVSRRTLPVGLGLVSRLGQTLKAV